MRIIFIRHGKATDQRDMPDHDRYLTEKGIRDLKKHFPFLVRYLTGTQWEIWSSDLRRAEQTAWMLADIMKVNSIIIKPFIASGNVDELKTALQTSETQNIVIVGHQPHLSDWVSRFCSAEIEFGKGGAAELTLDPAAFETCQLQWYFPLNSLHELPNPGSGRLFETVVKEKLSDWFLMVQESRQKFLNDPDDPETAHQVRVTIRTFRAILSVLRRFLGQKAYLQFQNEFRLAGSEVEYLRELDVILEICQEIRQNANGKEPQQTFLIRRLQIEREVEKNRLMQKFAAPKYTRKINKTFRDLMNSISFKRMKNLTTDDVVMPYLNRWYGWVDQRLTALGGIAFEDVHPIRLKCKKYRYVGEVFEDCLSETISDKRSRIKTLQTQLGDLCDVVRNQEAILEFAFNGDEKLQADVHQFIVFQKQQESQLKKKLIENKCT